MTRKTFYIFMALIALLSGCESEVADKDTVGGRDGENFTFFSSNDRYHTALREKANGSGTPFRITEVAYVDSTSNFLRITARHPDDCAGTFEIIWDGSVALSHPPQVFLVLKFNGSCGSEVEAATTTLLLDLDDFIGHPDISQGAIFHVINGSIPGGSNDQNASSN